MVWCAIIDMELDELETRTREALPEWRDAELSLKVIEKGGSGRLFVRVSEQDRGQSLILMHYSDDRSDNQRFASITDFLVRHRIPAPRIIERREDENLLWVDDLGEVDLGDIGDEPWEGVRGAAYFSALETVFRLHSIHESEIPSDLPELELSFDEALYQWEQEYFLNQYVARFLSAKKAEELKENSSLVQLRCNLAVLPRSLVHRDFQSTNVMVIGPQTFLIDYQGLRWGLPEYDLASLVYDPYTEFTDEQREELIDFYFELKKQEEPEVGRDEFRELLHQCATQRLMQAMGAYGFLSEVKGKQEFLQHIPAARQRLLEISGKPGGLPV
ncbi:MAG: phosphotransferase, partial [Verrucomicrobiota bacterium]